MRKFVIQTFLLVVLIGAALYMFKTNPSLTGIPFLPEKPVISNLLINGVTLKAEVANTADKRKQGLGGRQSIASDEGMLFVFPDSGKHPFWMKGLSFALDFVWISGETVVDLTPNVSPPTPGQADSALPIYQSKEDINKVLEVNGGTIQKLNIKIGDMVKVQ